MKFYDLHTERGGQPLSEVAEFAEKLGFTGIAVATSLEGLDEVKQEIKKTQSNIEIYDAVLIKAKNVEEMKQTIEKARNKTLIIIVAGGDYNINRAACENPKVDILAHPESGRIDNGLDDICIRQAEKNNVAIQVNLREILSSFRRQRSHILDRIAKNIRLCNKLKAPVIVCSGALNKWDMRDPRELVSMGNILGIELGNSFSTVSDVPHHIIENNKAKLEGKKLEGVETVG